MNQNSELIQVSDQHTYSMGSAAAERLDSWKEIAKYLRREVRTIQRWEKHESLPVRRHMHRGGNTVYAWKREIDEWLHRRSPVGARAVPPSKAVTITENLSQCQSGVGMTTFDSEDAMADFGTILRLLQCISDALRAHVERYRQATMNSSDGSVRCHELPLEESLSTQ